MGVGSEVCGALLNDRLGIGIELKPSYYRVAKRNIDPAKAEAAITMPPRPAAGR